MTTLDLDTLHLDVGNHPNPEAGMCLLEATALFSGEPFGDRPACVSPVLASFGISINDQFGDGRRQQLKRFIPLLPGTAGDGLDETRGFLALDWLIRTYTPTFLDLRPELAESAAALRGLPAIVDLATAHAAGLVVVAARDAAAAAARDAVRAAAWDAVRAAAWDSARAAAWDSVWDAAWDAVELQPTVDRLQDSAIDLFARMINPTGR